MYKKREVIQMIWLNTLVLLVSVSHVPAAPTPLPEPCPSYMIGTSYDMDGNLKVIKVEEMWCAGRDTETSK